MPNEETTTKFKVDISELKKSMQEAKRSAQLAHSEFKVAASECDNWQQSSNALSAKIKALNSTLNEQKTKLALLEAEYNGLTDAQKQGSAEATRLLTSINKQKAAINGTQREIDGYEASLKDVSKAEKIAEKSGRSVSDVLDELSDSADDAGKSAENAADGFTVFKGALATVAGNAISSIGSAIGGLISNFANLANETREYRTEMGKLNTAFTTNGHSAETATKTYNDLYAVLGDEGQAVEASNHLAKLAKTEEDLANWTNIATGVYGTFGASLPIEGLTEAANETAKVGQVTGPLADALKWAGESEEAFNEKLAACSSEQERQQLIMNTLNGLYGDAANKYKEVNGAIMDANRAQAEFTNAQAGLGAALEPVTTGVKLMGAEFLNTLLPSVTDLGQGFADLINGVDGAGASIGTSLGSMLTTALTTISGMLPQLAEVGISLIGGLITGIVGALPQLVTTLASMITTLINSLATLLPQIINTVIAILPQLINALVAAIPQIIQALMQFHTAIIQALPTIIQGLLSALPQLIDSLINGLLTYINVMVEGYIQLFSAIVQAIPQIVSALVAALPQIINSIIGGLLTAIPQLIQAAITLFLALVQAIPQIVVALISAIPQIIDAIITGLLSNIPLLLDAAIQVFMALVQAIPQIVVALVQALPQIITAIITTIFTLIPKLGEFIIQLIAKIGEWIVSLVAKGGEGASQFIENVINFIKELPTKIWTWLTNVISKVGQWIVNLVAKGQQAGNDFVSKVVNFFKELPSKLWTWLTNVISKVGQWIVNLVAKGQQAGNDFINSVINFVKSLPSKIWSFLTTIISNIGQWASNLASKGAAAAKNLFNSIVNGLKSLPSKIVKIGTDLVKGLWNGIKDATKWVLDKIKGFGESILNGIKSFFGIKSPSRVMRGEVGQWLAKGIAVGITEHSGEVTEAFQNIFDELQLQKDLGIISEEEYYKKLAEIRDEHLEIGSTAWWQYTKEIANYYNDATDAIIDKHLTAIDEIEQSRQDFADSLGEDRQMFGEVTFTTSMGTEGTKVQLTDWTGEIGELTDYKTLLGNVDARLKVAFGEDTENYEELMQIIRDGGLGEGKDLATLLLNASDAELQEYINGWREVQTLQDDISHDQFDDDIANQERALVDELTEFQKTVPEGFENTGLEAATNFINGFLSKLPDLVTQLKTAVSDAVSGAVETIDISGVAGAIGASMAYSAVGGGGTGGVVNNYTQVINSPQAIDRLTLYRQTNNLLDYKGGK